MKLSTLSILRIRLAVALLIALPATSALGNPPNRPQPQSGPFATPVTDALIDDSASAVLVDGGTQPLPNPAALRQIVWTQTAPPATGSFLQFGASPHAGPRSLRLGFKAPIPVGSVLVRGGGQLSVLRPGAAYPGNLADDSQWIPAQRIADHVPSSAEVDIAGYALWVLPAGTQTRALRFTHLATQTDSNFAGTLGGVYILASRLTNLAPESVVHTSANTAAAPRLNDTLYNGWLAWDNGPTFPHAVTAKTPEWVTLTWPQAIPLRGLALLWAGFNAADVQVFNGPPSENPETAPDSDWKQAAAPLTLHNQYPIALGIDWADFGQTLQTRAVRLRITGITDESHHPHLVGKTRGGNRVWLGEIMALSPLLTGSLQAVAQLVPAQAGPKPPIPIQFTLPTAGNVTLVIEDAQGNRVRNLIADTPYPAGPNTAWWDGTDDLQRNPDAAIHGVYAIPTHFVAPGQYRVRGLYHQPIDLRYEFSVYSAGSPAWETADGTGGWLANHTPPSATLFVPANKAPGGKPLVYLGSYVTEGGAGLAWVDLEGHKLGGRGWIGGSWTGAPYLARDTGEQADPRNIAYVASVWGDDPRTPASAKNATIRITAITQQADKAILKYPFTTGGALAPGEDLRHGWLNQVTGLAVHNNLAVVSLNRLNQLLLIDTVRSVTLGSLSVDDPRGLAFDPQGNLLVLAGQRLLRYTLPASNPSGQMPRFGAPQVVVATGFEDPAGLTADANGDIYISDRGSSNQVKVFSASGKPLRVIGRPGPSLPGPYDPLHMNNPRGLSLDDQHRLWVAEEDVQPKRVSVWNSAGQLVQAFYGPPEYGGGGALDPQDKTKFYYHGMQFALNWQTGSNSVSSILYRPAPGDLKPPIYGDPVNVLYSNGHRYFTNSFLGYPTNGVSVGMLYLDEGGVLHPVAALGKANDWPILQDQAFAALLPPGSDLTSRSSDKSVFFTWSDLNQDGKVSPNEVSFLKAFSGSITIVSAPQAAGPVMLNADLAGKAMRFAPVRVTPQGIPVYDLQHGQLIADGAQIPAADGGGQILASPQATILTTAPLPFARESLGGIDHLGHRWSYPNLWPGLHPAHSAPVADHPGEILGATRLLGDFIHAPAPAIGDLWAINGNFGPIYLFTADGLYVTQLFQDVRVGKPWSMPQAPRNMLLNDVTPHDENFFPSLTETTDGKVYLVDGGRTSLVRVDGLNTLRPLPDALINVTPADLDKARAFLTQSEEARQQLTGPQSLAVVLRPGAPPALATLVNTLSADSWATIDARINQIGWNGQPVVTQAAVTIAGGQLLVAYRTGDPNLLHNAGNVLNAPFKTGGALDIMIGTNPQADPNRPAPVPGDQRLLVYQVNGQAHALLYKAVVPGTKTPIPFSSPDRTITFDQVIDVSSSVQLIAANGDYALSIPLQTLGLSPHPGDRIKADLGILRGTGTQTSQRVYWSNKATGITSDVPSEAQLTPALWGTWTFKTAAP